MSQFKDTRNELDNLEVSSVNVEERLTSPRALRSLHTNFCRDDSDSSANRAAIQELMDFVPPYDPEELRKRGMSERFNVNFGLAASTKNEAVGAYLDIVTSPTILAKIVLEPDVDPELRDFCGGIMSEEWTKMQRQWDGWLPNCLLLADMFVTQGIGITWFEDKSTILFQVNSLEDCKFGADTVAVPSKIPAMTIERNLDVTDLYSKIEGREDEEDIDGWNGPVIRKLIVDAKPKSLDGSQEWNYEAVARAVKSSRLGASHDIPSITLIWGVIKELDGTVSIYATGKSMSADNNPLISGSESEDEKWVYRKRSSYDDANQMMQMFAFSIGNKNRIYTIRGLGYALYESGQADNILRCKMMDSARHRAGEMFQPESSIDSIEDLQFIDLGFGVVVPKGLRGIPSQNLLRMDEGIGYAIESNKGMIDRHSAGLSSNSITENPNARRNEMQVTAELDQLNKMTGFAISLWYGPWDKLIRESIRRAFTESQTDLTAAKLVKEMKDACERRGVPREFFSKIDFGATMATRLQGAGSKGSRIISFQQMGQLYSSMDAQGQENYSYDFASEIQGNEKAIRYFGLPGERRGHVDIALAQLENAQLLEGTMLDPVDGENHMVHLQSHLEALVDGMEGVEQGTVDLSEWTLQQIPLFRHSVDTLEVTSVHESLMAQLNTYRQQIQQVGEVIDNGLRHINKNRQQEGQAQVGPDGLPIQGAEGQDADPAATAAQKDLDLKRATMFAEAQAKIQIMASTSQAKLAIEKQEAIQDMGITDAKAAAEIKRKQMLARAGS